MNLLLKKLVLSLTAMSAVFLLTTSAYALSFIMGDYKFVMDGVSRFESPLDPATGAPTGESGNLWGIAQVQSIFRDAVSGQGLYGENYWSSGSNSEFLTLKFGGISLALDAGNPSGYHITDSFGAPVATTVYPHQSYFVGVGNFAQLYLNNTNPYANDVFTVGANPAADGAIGSFGTTLDNGILVLDMEFAAGGLYVDEMKNTGVAAAYTNEVYRSVASANTRNETLGYLDIKFAAAGWSGFDTNGWYDQEAALLAAVGRTEGFDIRIEASNSSATPVVLTPAMIAAGWNARTESSSALSTVVPEPASMFLMGTGLLFIAGSSRKRSTK